MRKNSPQTPLLALLRALTPEQRTTLATEAGTSVSYLYALGSCQRAACGSPKAAAIQAASEKMHEATDGLTPIVTMQQLATMCTNPAAD